MHSPWLNAAQKLEFRDPRSFLARIREIEIDVAMSDTPARVKNLRTNSLKSVREMRQAALFTYGMGVRIGQPIYFSATEDQDYDLVATWIVGDKQHLAPVQLKEVVPKSLNPAASLNSVLAGLRKYVDSAELTVAVFLNQSGTFEPSSIDTTGIKVAALWVVAAASPNQSEWRLWGNFMEPDAWGTSFEYPTEPPQVNSSKSLILKGSAE